MSTVIKVENLSKQYRLGDVGTGSIAHDVNRAWYKLRGKEDPYLKIGETNDRTKKGDSDYVWAIKDINFEVKQGEVLGIIGRNGAGKSTLLKILSRTTTPTTGSVKIKGRVASLLEVGTGFHPELSGRENIFLNGAIMGMTKQEIKRKFDEIVDFAGVERYIDTPVKRYSSGMYVRLAFGVAAHLEPEILIVDEVLAVGDAEFQKKALGKMKDVSEKEGRTVLFVSHNLAAISTLCNKGIFLKNGQVFYNGLIEDVLNCYNQDKKVSYSREIKILANGKKIWLTNFSMKSKNENSLVETFDLCYFKIGFESTISDKYIFIGIGVSDQNETRLFTLFSKYKNISFPITKGYNEVICKMESMPLKPGIYNVEIFLGTDEETLDYYSDGLQIEITNTKKSSLLLPDSSQGNIIINQNWYVNDIK